MARDPVLTGLLVVAALVLLGYLVPVGGSWGRLLAFWPVQIVLDVVLTIGALRVVRVPGVPHTTRRFWRSMVLAGALLTLGDTVQALQNLGHVSPAILVSGNVQLVLIAAGVSCPVWAMLTHPIPGLRRERLRFWLDAGATMIAAAVFVWTFLIGDGRADPALLLFTATAGVLLVSAFGVVKLTLSANPPFHRGPAVIGGLGALLIGIGTVLQPPVEETWVLHLFMTARLLPCVLFAACARMQERALRAVGQSHETSTRRRHSRLPYVAAAAVQALMIVLLFQAGLPLRLAGGLIGLTLVIALVIARQLVTFADVDSLMSEVSRQEQRFRALVREASDVTLVMDRHSLITYASPALHRVLGLNPEAVIGKPLADGLHPQDVVVLRDAVSSLMADPGSSVSWRARTRHIDGGWRWLEIISTNRLDDPSVGGIISNARDITLARDLEQQLRYQAMHDQLTGLGNRQLFTERLDAIARDDGTSGALAGMLAIDLNDFKPINDELGHQAGDAVLVAVARRLKTCAEATGTVARLGGDEFAVVLYPTTASEADAMVERVRSAVSAPMRIAGRDLVVRASIGVATGPPAAARGLLETADAAMYETKRSAAASR